MFKRFFTSVEQSKQLLELGVDAQTADMVYYGYINRNGKKDYYSTPEIKPPLTDFSFPDRIFPCWSLYALIDLIPTNLPVPLPPNPKQSDYIHTNEFEIRYRFDYTWQCGYSEIHQVGDYEDLLRAIFEMVVWLRKNGYKKEEL